MQQHAKTWAAQVLRWSLAPFGNRFRTECGERSLRLDHHRVGNDCRERRQIGGSVGSVVQFVSLAVYDAVNAITGQYRPFYYQGAGPRDASIDAAAASTAHDVLVYYFPSQQAG